MSKWQTVVQCWRYNYAHSWVYLLFAARVIAEKLKMREIERWGTVRHDGTGQLSALFEYLPRNGGSYRDVWCVVLKNTREGTFVIF